MPIGFLLLDWLMYSLILLPEEISAFRRAEGDIFQFKIEITNATIPHFSTTPIAPDFSPLFCHFESHR
jgi:hypothetical protein